MPTIDAAEHDYTVRIREGVAVTFNAYVLLGMPEGPSLQQGGEEAMSRLASRLRDVKRSEPADAVLNDAELLACYTFILKDFDRLGNLEGSQPAVSRATADYPNHAPSQALS